MAVNSAEQCEGAHGDPILSDEGIKIPQCESDSLLGVPGLMNTTGLNSHIKCQNDTCVKVDIMDIYSSTIQGTDIEQGKLEIPKSTAEVIDKLKTEDCLPKLMQREIDSCIGAKFMQLLMSNSFELRKFAARDKCTTPTSRSRKYKRSVSFNSRRVVFLFSVLSSLGTIILIYLTLRVRLVSNGSVDM